MGKVLCFGEIMMRLNPHDKRRLVQSDILEVSYAGGEANVAVCLSNLGDSAVFLTKVPDNEIGRSALNALQRYGVDVSRCKKGGERLGLYFVEKGASQRPSKVIYDRKHSSIADSVLDEFDLEGIFEGVDWFHFTGITPALSDGLADVCLHMLKYAKEHGITVSCDLNYRNKLWSKEKAGKVMTVLAQYVDVCMCNEEDAYDVFGIKAGNSDVASGSLDREGYVDAAKQLEHIFGFSHVAFTLRTSISADENRWAGMLYSKGQAFFSREYLINIVDRVGGGDSFCGGLIHALRGGCDMQYAIEFAIAASCLKHTIEQDFNLVSAEEVDNLVKGDVTGRVKR